MAQERPICINALTVPPQLGGIGNYCYRLLQEFLAREPGMEFVLLASAATAESFRPLGPRLRIVAVRLESRIARLLWLHLVFPFRASRYRLVHSVGNMGLALCPAPQVITIHDVYEHVSPERFGRGKRLLMSWLIARSGASARAVLTVSHSTRGDIARFYPALAPKLRVVAHGCKFPVLADRPYGDRRDFLFLGTLEPGKNLALSLRAFARYRKAHGERLLVVGARGWKQSHIPGLLRELGIEDAVEFPGYVPDADLPGLFGRCRALLQSSLYEGFGLPVIEAMACGCPVIAARNSGLVEAGGDAALFFETNDEDGLFAWMERLRADPGLGEERVRMGYAHAARFGWGEAALATLAAYREALAGGGKGSHG